MEVLPEQCGGGCGTEDMGIAAGGLIKQSVKRDRYAATSWEPDCTAVFNIQILNSECFRNVVGEAPPNTPISAATYAQHGFPYYKLWDEQSSGVEGDFSYVKSVNELDLEGKPTEQKAKAVREVIRSTHNPVVTLDVEGRKVGFRTASELEKAVRARFSNMYD